MMIGCPSGPICCVTTACPSVVLWYGYGGGGGYSPVGSDPGAPLMLSSPVSGTPSGPTSAAAAAACRTKQRGYSHRLMLCRMTNHPKFLFRFLKNTPNYVDKQCTSKFNKAAETYLVNWIHQVCRLGGVHILISVT